MKGFFIAFALIFSCGSLAFSDPVFTPNEHRERRVVNYLVPYHVDVNTVSNEIFMSTTPRSGTSLSASIIQQLTGKGLLWNVCPSHHARWEEASYVNRACVKIDQSLLPILGTHYVPMMLDLLEKNPKLAFQNRLIITLRDYKEVFCRDYLSFNLAEIEMYMNHLALYDSWDPKNRYLIHYETLAQNPLMIVDDLSLFLNASSERKDLLLDNFEQFWNAVYKNYAKFRGVKSDGKKTEVHQKKATLDQLLRLEKLVKDCNPYLYNKYLTRYKIRR